MVVLPDKPTPAALEQEARSLWAGQRLPPLQGPMGAADGPVVHLFLGAFAAQEVGTLAVQRAVAADVDARAMILAGRRAQGSLRMEDGGPPVSVPRLDAVLGALGVWVGGSEGHSWDVTARRAEVARLVGRLAHTGALAVRDVSLRICPTCAMARSPERLVYDEEDGETLLVRFAFPDGDRTVSALVWTDAAWRLLGTSALMVHPDLPYVIARYTRKGSEEFVFTSKSSIERIREWLPGSAIEVLEEHPGRHWEGRSYEHPLRHEFPMGGALEPPGGTIVPVGDVSDTGTGVVPLVPGHGGTDTQIADRLSVPGWPLVTPKGRFDILFIHKYAGLELESGSEFVERDLEEGGAIFARLRVRRGVPRCVRCGTALIWAPGRAWCLEPSRLPPEKLALYRALLPRERPIERLEAVPWPVSEPQRGDDGMAIPLLECTSCDRLDAIDHPEEKCVCGGRRRVVRRRLLPAFDAAASAWAGVDPFPAADAARLYVNDRRRAPAVVHQIAAMSGVLGNPGEVRLTVLPTVPESDVGALVRTHGADAVRAAFVRSQDAGGSTATFAERCTQEALRLERLWRTVGATLASIDSAALPTLAQPIGGSLGDLEPEDRAMLARFERLRVQALVDYDRSSPASVHRHLFHFLENDLPEYLRWVRRRLAETGNPPAKRAAQHTLVHVLSAAVQLLGPIAPHTAEAIHRTLRRSRASLFQEPAAGVERALLDPGRAKAWDRWIGVIRSVAAFRRSIGVAPDTVLPVVALVVDPDTTADEYRAEAPTIERLARIAKLEVGSPGAPWAGRRRQLRPREAEIQRVYASRAAQIIHLLRRMPERKATDAASGQGFSVMVNGQPTQILPSMIAWEETIPDRFVSVEWSVGEMYAEMPAGASMPSVPVPPLSPDAYRLVRRVARQLRATPPTAPPALIVVAPPPLTSELLQVAGPLAKYLGVAELRAVTSDIGLPPHGRGFGRTKAGAPWSFHLSDRPPTRRVVKHRSARAAPRRVRPAFSPADLVPTSQDYADPDWVAREGSIRALGEELDELLGAPLLGPAKVSAAWEAGLRSVDAFRSAPWITLVGLPGYGVPVATALVSKFGGTVPPRPSLAERRAARMRPPPSHAEPLSDPAQWHEPAATAPVVSPRSPETRGRARPTSPLVPPPPTVRPPNPPPRSGPSAETSPSSRAAPLPNEALPIPTPPADVPPMDTTRTEPPSGPMEEAPAPPPPEVLPPADGPAPTLAVEATRPGDSGPLDRTSSMGIESTEEGSREIAGDSVSPIPEAEVPLPADAGIPGAPENVGSEESAPSVEVTIPDIPPPPSPPEASTPKGVSEGSGDTVPAGSEAEPPPTPEPVQEDAASPAEAELLEALQTTPEPPASPPPDDSPPPSATPSAEAELLAALEPPPESPPPSAVPALSEAATPALDSAEPSVPEPDAPEPDGPSILPSADDTAPAPSLPVPIPAPVEPDGPPPEAPSVVPPPVEPALPSALEPIPTAPVLEPAASVAESVGFPPLVAPLPPPPAPSGGIDLQVGPSYVPALERFLEATAAGHQGICVVRDSPERVRAYVGTRPVEIRWLTNIGRGPTLKPTDLEGFSAFLAHAVSAGHVTAFFLEGLEYLVRLHGLDRVIERMGDLDRLAREHSARVWVPLNPKLLSGPELDRFVSAFGPRSG